VLRFIFGGTVVSTFSLLGDLFTPKSFAGIFGAAPSVALASLGLAVATRGRAYAGSEACAMIAGALAFSAYASLLCWLGMRLRWRLAAIAAALIPVWLVTGIAIWWTLLT